MDISLTDNEARVLGCLMEKEMATPDYYPLSLNALINACNQKSNRNPVVSYDEEIVLDALKSLREHRLVRQSNVGRVTKYEQVFSQELKLVSSEQAIICSLLLRGPQTIGEIRGRTERLYAFGNLDEAQETLTNLENMTLVQKLPRQPGMKESRYTHLLSEASAELPLGAGPPAEVAPVLDHNDMDRIGGLQKQVDELRAELQRLQQDFETFKSQFD